MFDNPTISGKFLILGKPGGGKTTTLLELAEALIDRAEGDSNAPIPVILELSTWQEVTKPKFLAFVEREKYDPSIKEWVLSQLMSKGVIQEIGEEWLQQKKLVLLLDGLDELQPERQGKCVRAINQFLSSEFSPLHLVVCSRKEEYEVYEEMLHLNGAICLEDLTNEQIRNYFASVNLGEFWESIKGSEKIVDFIRQPLFLAVTSLAYQQIDVEEWRNCNTEERAIDYLLGVYRIQVLERKTQNSYVSPILKTLAQTIDTSMEFTFQDVDPLSFLQKFNKGAFWNLFITILDLLVIYFIGKLSWEIGVSLIGDPSVPGYFVLLLPLFVTIFALIVVFVTLYFPGLPFYNIFWINAFDNPFWINDKFTQQIKKINNIMFEINGISIIFMIKTALHSAFKIILRQSFKEIASTLIKVVLASLPYLFSFILLLLISSPLWIIFFLYLDGFLLILLCR